MYNVEDFDYLKVNLASPSVIESWGTRTWDESGCEGQRKGEVENSDTIGYKDLKPVLGGLFCERNFGTLSRYHCHCGKLEGTVGTVCFDCGVRITDPVVRRRRVGTITLETPVVHLWYFKGRPSKLAHLLGWKIWDLEQLIYCYTERFIRVDNPLIDKLRENIQIVDEILGLEDDSDDEDGRELYPYSYTEHTGGEAIKLLLDQIDLEGESKRLRMELNRLEYPVEEEDDNSNDEDPVVWLRRLRLIEHFIAADSKPSWMVLTVLPVLPPALRPILQLDDGLFVSSDLNHFYRRIVTRNNRLRQLKKDAAPSLLIVSEKRLLQQSVDALIENGKGGPVETDSSGRSLVALSDIIRGKEGRIRQNLLGKRVDYSGRSVIASGAELGVGECGVPYEMVLELFRPFVLHCLIHDGYAKNLKTAEKILQERRPFLRALIVDLLEGYPILVNRAPTLHRFGIQAFSMVITFTRAIRMPSVVCVGFNADFDGDQVAIHVPLSLEAVAEATFVMSSAEQVVGPAAGEPVMVPTQDMVLGLHFITQAYPLQDPQSVNYYFGSFNSAREAFLAGHIPVNALIWVRFDRDVRTIDLVGLEERDYLRVKRELDGRILSVYVCTTVGRIFLNLCLN